MQVKEEIRLDAYEVRYQCCKRRWYTEGDNAEYEKMLAMCETATLENINQVLYAMAKDIVEHSVDGITDITNTMYVLSRYAVERFYEVIE